MCPIEPLGTPHATLIFFSPLIQAPASPPHSSGHPQGKLEPEARQQLIAKGQLLKQQLEELEVQLVHVENALQVRLLCMLHYLAAATATAAAVSHDMLT